MEDILCPSLACKEHAWGETVFECGSYTIEDSRKLRARMTLLSDTLSGSINGANYVNQIITPEDKVRMYSENYERVAVFKAPQDTRGLHDCGPFQPQKLKPRYVEDRFLHMYPLEMELAFCLPKFFPTWKKNMATNSGFRNRWRNPGFLPWLTNEVVMNNAQLQLDYLLMRGDYGSPIKYLSQFDGIVKKIYNYSVTYIPEVVQINVPAMGAGDIMHLAVGGQTTDIAFDTDQATTVGNIVAWLNTLLDQVSNEPYYSITTNSNDTIWVSEKDRGWGVYVQAYVDQNATYSWQSTDESCVAGLAEIAQTAGNRHSPIKDDWGPITKDNIWDWMCEFFYMALGYFDEMSGPDPDQIVVFVSEQFIRMKDLAVTNMTRAFRGVDEIRNKILGIQFIPNKRLKGSEYFATWAGNLQYATDLVSDFGTVRTWFNEDCEELRMKMRGKAGVDILYPGEFITNIPCLQYNFQPIAPKDQYKCKIDCGTEGVTLIDCPACEAAFSWKVQVSQGSDESYIVLEDKSGCPATAAANYDVYITSADGTTVILNTANKDHTFTIAGATALDNTSIQVTQTLTGLGGDCPDKSVTQTEHITPGEAEEL